MVKVAYIFIIMGAIILFLLSYFGKIVADDSQNQKQLECNCEKCIVWIFNKNWLTKLSYYDQKI